jgi:sialate O-acetylesterase
MRVRRLFALTAAAVASGFAAAPSRADVITNVPLAELAGYQVVYEWNIPDNSAGWNTVAVPYTVNTSATIATGSYDRVAYYLELDGNWVYASFNASGFLADPKKLGVPANNATNGTGVASNMTVSSMNVYSNVGGITTGTGLTGGKVEFWPSNYGAGANNLFDHDDNGFGTTSGHGSMQIHNTAVPQTLFAYNAWGAARDSELGIGTGPNPTGTSTGTQRDWTFNASNNDLYTTQRMQILVHLVPEPGTVALLAGALPLLVTRGRRGRRGH